MYGGGRDGVGTAEELAGKRWGRDATAEIEAMEKILVEFRGKTEASDFWGTD